MTDKPDLAAALVRAKRLWIFGLFFDIATDPETKSTDRLNAIKFFVRHTTPEERDTIKTLAARNAAA